MAEKQISERAMGRPPLDAYPRKKRTLGITDKVFAGLKILGRGSASQAINDLYLAEVERQRKKAALAKELDL